MSIQNLREKLYDKAFKEQSDFIDDLKQQPPEKIIEASYEKVMRDDILMSLEPDEDFLSDKQVKALLKLDYPLSACYGEWMDNDCSHMEMLRDTIEDFAKELVEENEQAKANKKKNEPER